jgi:hypothetical protein
MRRWIVAIACSTSLAGCMDGDRNPFPSRGNYRSDRDSNPNMPVASVKAATRLDAIGAQIVAANKADIGVKPLFFAVGIEKPMVFHRGTSEIVVSEGLMAKCQTDAELAAVISNELAKMIVERDGKSPRRNADMEAPPAPRVTGDALGFGSDPDMTRRAEEAIYTRRQPAPRLMGRNGPRETSKDDKPDAGNLAKNYLTKAGHPPEELGKLASLIKQAETNSLDREFLK